ncbi:IclR family transcriptional regulator [Mesorhizobium huakuii]|uniref:IclR family transcriptional regulator n=1 Tax=Mesorhizobium huakuii TaxID=28104 RepID=A0ABZ0VNH8_9HYPH|nr:IclR family transcriptional regulator [Mesorhizobium huakuii]WQB98502.1 IclR family transcriptional regulator [Mesorhizobium huakuii]
MKTLDTALKLLKLFETEEQTLSVTEIAEATALPKSKVSRLLADFRANGFLEQDEQTRRYRVGLAAFELGSNYIKSQPLAHAALPVLRQIVERTGHSTTLSVMRGDLILHILAVEGPHYIDGRWRVGNRLPFHATSAGKVLLAGLTPAGFEAFVANRRLDPITASTVTDPEVFRRQVEETRDSGVSLTRGESAPGLSAIAVPVLGRSNDTVAALGLIIPDRFFAEEKTDTLTALLHEEARTLSIKCGAADYPFGSANPSPRHAAAKSAAPV